MCVFVCLWGGGIVPQEGGSNLTVSLQLKKAEYISCRIHVVTNKHIHFNLL